MRKSRKTDFERNKITFSRFSRKVSGLDPTLLHSFNINVAIAVILVYKRSLYDAQEPRYQLSRCNGNFCKTQNLQILNTRKIIPFSRNTLKLCTLVDHYRVDNTSKFHCNQIFIEKDMALQSCLKIAIFSKFLKIFKFSRFCLTSNFYPCYSF